MYPSNSNGKDKVDVDHNLQIRQTNSSPITSNHSRSSSPSCTTLLVIDDTSNSEDSTINNSNNHIPVKLIPLTNAQLSSHIQIPTTISPSTHLDIGNGTIEQQRRRNSSIAKLLGGHPLHNQQYEEINQQILDAQSAHNLSNNNDNGIDNGIQRSRSSITRTLLMNAERTNSMTKLPPKPQTVSSQSFSKDFEYLIRQEVDKLDNEHSPSTLHRNNSSPKVIQNLNSPSNINAQLKLKRKRPITKPPLPTSNLPPFSLHEPFELQSSETNSNPSINHSQNKFFHTDSSKRPRYPNPQQQYHLPPNQSSYPYPKVNINSSLYNQLNMSQDRGSSNNCSTPCNCSHYSNSTKLTLPLPITHLSSSANISHNNNNNNVNLTSSTRKAKSMLLRPDINEPSRRRSYSNTSNQSDSSLEVSSKTTIPLKKRLLDAYNNEQRPPSPL